MGLFIDIWYWIRIVLKGVFILVSILMILSCLFKSQEWREENSISLQENHRILSYLFMLGYYGGMILLLSDAMIYR